MRAVSRPPACLSDFVLDEWTAGELDADAVRAADAHLHACARCRARREALLAARAAFLAQAPSFAAHAAGLGKGSAAVPPRRGRRAWFAAAATAAAAAALLAVVAVQPASRAPGLEPNRTRSKGAPRIGFFVLRAERVTRGASGDTVYPGDRLRFVYSSESARQLALFDRDAAGATVFFPAGDRSAEVRAGHEVALDFSVELDDRLGEERVHAVFCPEPFALEPLRAALAQGAALPLGPGCTADTIILHKAQKP